MRVYRVLWLLGVVCVVAVGVTEALLVVRPLTLWSAGVVIAVLSGVCRLTYVARRQLSPSTGTTALVVAAGAAIGVGLTGLTALLAGGAVGLLVVLACTHPRLVHVVARRAQRRSTRKGGGAVDAGATRDAGPGCPASAPDPAQAPAGPAWRRSPGSTRGAASTPAADPGWPDAAAIQQVSTAQLCWGWRLSFTALERTDPRLDRERWWALIAVRRRYLDELARREPAGFARWLYTGARPASDPSPYLRPSTTRQEAGPPSPA